MFLLLAARSRSRRRRAASVSAASASAPQGQLLIELDTPILPPLPRAKKWLLSGTCGIIPARRLFQVFHRREASNLLLFDSFPPCGTPWSVLPLVSYITSPKYISARSASSVALPVHPHSAPPLHKALPRRPPGSCQVPPPPPQSPHTPILTARPLRPARPKACGSPFSSGLPTPDPPRAQSPPDVLLFRPS
ncbi:hypothetical protein P154DRAFT_144990 [Amniculicola lignicola CBS 123094]|uniref:Uncharacterized protein n=1 Tax=Amniculicola lignicola CBS 123094 TaxID=1392246 RepID=A0A6A5WT81_9PLEO|nr:hypothetical protein P154DRAFT_144990 [Amniculicola lignicola CBS 123094]